MPNLPDQETQPLLRPGEAAKVLGVTTRTLADMKDLHPVRLPSGHRRYVLAEIERIARERDAA